MVTQTLILHLVITISSLYQVIMTTFDQKIIRAILLYVAKRRGSGSASQAALVLTGQCLDNL